MAPSVSITIHTPDDGAVSAVFDSRMDWPTPTVGETFPFTFWFEEGAGATKADRYSGFTTLREYLDFQGAFDAGLDVDDRPWYREQLPSGAKTSLVWGIEPSTDLKEQVVPGVWGLVESGSDERNPALSNWRLDVDVRVLARFERYDTLADVQADLEA